jgi:hypothetical protein
MRCHSGELTPIRRVLALQAFVGDARPYDDVSLMVLRRVNHA